MKRKKVSQAGPPRVALYLRVSSGQQAKNDLSVPDQRRMLQGYCAQHGWEVVSEFVDSRSARDDNRPAFQRMIEEVECGKAGFDIILVHSFSRFYRDGIEGELKIRSLMKRGVHIESATQEADTITRRIIMMMDEHQSAETSKHVTRTQRENARQGFWNGGFAPYGYRSVEAARRGATIKKKLDIEPEEEAVVRLVFDLFLEGDGESGPLGVKSATDWLNTHGYRVRSGKLWGNNVVHRILTDTTVKGTFIHGKKSGGETIEVDVPAIIPAKTFDEVQGRLRERNPKKTPPRVVTGPILLTGLATCGLCGEGMLLRTGKNGQYRYYTCGGQVRKGKTACPGLSVPMAPVDELVIDQVISQLFKRDRMKALLAGLFARQTARDEERAGHLGRIRETLTEKENRLRRLYDAIEAGAVGLGDPTLKERIARLCEERDLAQIAVDRAAAELNPAARVTEEKLSSFIELMATNLRTGSIEFRRAYLRSIIDEVQIHTDKINIIGRKNQLERAA
jgi:DNA invertase Pin-like site-specific DNA recombinase